MGGRIDSYLAGSPLSGQGATFAAAAWDYGVDPRFFSRHLVRGKLQGGCVLPSVQCLGLGLGELGKLGGGHRRSCARSCARIRLHVERSGRQEILPAELAALALARRRGDGSNLRALLPGLQREGRAVVG